MTSSWIELPLPDDVVRLEAVIKDVAYRLHREVGPGHRESVYRRFVVHSLARQGLSVETDRSFDLAFDGLRLERALIPDVVVDDRVVIELKAVEKLLSIHHAQVLSYVRRSGMPLGILLNFHVPWMKDGYHRYVAPQFLRRQVAEP